ncbi:hypothetical protein Lesp02_53920 [Lentzea sp. NBRC 105346]|nr:hypothetical protein Lesp02_53920 [Lentzea sp. NBRC 105346]
MAALALGLSACGIRFVEHAFEDDKAVSDKIESVVIQTGSGNVSIRYTEGTTQTTIHRRVTHRRDQKPEGETHKVDGKVLTLNDCGNDCSVDYQVNLPSKEVKVGGTVGSGDVTVEGLAEVDVNAGSGHVIARHVGGKVRIDASSGDVVVEDAKGDVTAHVGSGHARLQDIKGKTTVDSGSGDISGSGIDNDVNVIAHSGHVELRMVSKRTVRAETGSGDIILRVPDGPYKVDTESGSGDKHIDIATDPNATTVLNLRAGSGNITVSPA